MFLNAGFLINMSVAVFFFPSLNRCNSVCKLNISQLYIMSLSPQPERSTFLSSSQPVLVNIRDSQQVKAEPF